MKTIKLCLSILLVLVVVSCNKKDDPKPDDAKLDLTNYFITMEFPTEFTGGRTYNLPLLIVFNDDEKSTLYSFSSPPPEAISHQLENDKIKITYGSSNWEFTIKDQVITAVSGFVNQPKNVKLHKVPATNQFVGNYSGMLNARLVSNAFPFRYAFNQTQFGEEMVSDPTLDYVITPIKNVFAMSFIDSVKRYFLVIDGKLIVVRMKMGGTNAESFMYGSLTKD